MSDTFGEPGGSAPVSWPRAVRAAAFGAGAAALIGVAAAFGPSTAAVAGTPEPILPPPVICHNSTCCVDPTDPPNM